MLPKEYRQRYLSFFALSLLLHFALVAYLIWNPIFEEPKKDKGTTVEIKLKQAKKTEQAKKEEKKEKEKASSKKKESEKKKEQEKKKEKKKEEKKEEKKAEPKKAKEKPKEQKQPEKKEPEKKKSEKKEAKKQESKKDPLSETFSVDKAKDSKSKTAEQSQAKQGQKQQEVAKPKGQQTTKAKEAASKAAKSAPKTKPAPQQKVSKPAKAKQGQPKQGEPKAGEAAKAAPAKSPQPPKAPEAKKKPVAKELDPNALEYWTKKWGSKQVMKDREMKRNVVMTKGLDAQFQQRTIEGDAVVKSLNRYQKQQFNKYLMRGANKIVESYVAPKKDGRQYYGAISILLDRNGFIVKMAFKRPSGHAALDRAMYEAVANTSQLELPPDPQAAYAMYLKPLEFSYDETDMAD